MDAMVADNQQSAIMELVPAMDGGGMPPPPPSPLLHRSASALAPRSKRLVHLAVTARDEGNNTPLHWAAMGGHICCILLLCAAGADLSAQNGESRTAEQCARNLAGEVRDATLQALRGLYHYALRCQEAAMLGNTDVLVTASHRSTSAILPDGKEASVNVTAAFRVRINGKTAAYIAAEHGHRTAFQLLTSSLNCCAVDTDDSAVTPAGCFATQARREPTAANVETAQVIARAACEATAAYSARVVGEQFEVDDLSISISSGVVIPAEDSADAPPPPAVPSTDISGAGPPAALPAYGGAGGIARALAADRSAAPVPPPPPPAARRAGEAEAADDAPPPYDFGAAELRPARSTDEMAVLLQAACRSGDAAEAARLIADGAPKCIKDPKGQTEIHAAATGGSVECLRLVINALGDDRSVRRTACVDPDNSGMTAVHVAAASGRAKTLEMLLNIAGAAAATMRNPFNDMSPLHLACEAGHAEVVSTLLQLPEVVSAEGSRRAGDKGWTPLHFAAAARSNAGGISTSLLGKGCESLPDVDGNNPLHLACAKGAVDAVVALLSACDVLQVNSSGELPAELATRNRHEKCAEFVTKEADRRAEALADKERKAALEAELAKLRAAAREKDPILGVAYTEIKDATGDWSADSCSLGGGWYSAKLKGVRMAIRRYSDAGAASVAAAKYEVEVLRRLQHPNVLALKCSTTNHPGSSSSRPCLVYSAVRQSLRVRLSADDIDLLWSQRVAIAVGISAALEYLHCGAPSRRSHGDLCAANIFLDVLCRPLVTGLVHSRPIAAAGAAGGDDDAELRRGADAVSRVAGAHGAYAPPEGTGADPCKADMYAFGVILVQLVAGRSARHRGDGDPGLGEEEAGDADDAERGGSDVVEAFRDAGTDAAELRELQDGTAAWPDAVATQLWDLARRLLRVDPGSRPSASDAARALDAIARDAHATPEEVEEALLRKPRVPSGAEQDLAERMECPMCLDDEKNTLLVPCGHLLCGACSGMVMQCPQCRTDITDRMRAYL